MFQIIFNGFTRALFLTATIVVENDHDPLVVL